MKAPGMEGESRSLCSSKHLPEQEPRLGQCYGETLRAPYWRGRRAPTRRTQQTAGWRETHTANGSAGVHRREAHREPTGGRTAPRGSSPEHRAPGRAHERNTRPSSWSHGPSGSPAPRGAPWQGRSWRWKWDAMHSSCPFTSPSSHLHDACRNMSAPWPAPAAPPLQPRAQSILTPQLLKQPWPSPARTPRHQEEDTAPPIAEAGDVWE